MGADLPEWNHQITIDATWGDLVELRYGKSLKDYKEGNGVYPVFGTNGPVGYCDKPLCDYPSVIIGRKGAYRGVHFSNTPFFVIDTAYYIEPKFNINLRWAYYQLLTADINGLDSGSAIPSTRREDFYALPVKIPPKKIQDEIVRVLDSINNKIHLNTQTNQTLESIAQAIFKSWFVDFEPVKAKMAVLESGGTREQAELAAMGVISGKSETELAQLQQQNPEHYQQLAETAALFPSAMVDAAQGSANAASAGSTRAASELGETNSSGTNLHSQSEPAGGGSRMSRLLPEGWDLFQLSDFANLNEKSWTTKNSPSQISYVDLANTKWGVINSIESYEYNDAPSRARRILRKNDTIIGTVRPGNGSFSFIKTDNLTGSTGFAVLSPKQEVFSELIYIAATSSENIERLAHLADGGAYPAVRPEIVMETCITLPALEEIRLKISSVFHAYNSSLFDAINRNQTENGLLAQLRDSLLPKLLSGEIDLTHLQSEVA